MEAVAAANDRPPLELAPLQHAIDTDAVDDVFSNRSAEGHLVVPYAGITVRIEDGDAVLVYE